MKADPTLTEVLFEKISNLFVTYIELLKLKSIERITKVAGGVLPDVVVAILMLVFLLFINLGLAFWLGDLLGRIYLGFIIVAAFYFVLAFISHFFVRNRIKKAATNYFIKQFFS